MSQIDYQKLREIAEKTKIAGEAPVMPFDQRINALNDFMKHFSPDIALALLDERERNQQYIKRRDQENEDIALTVGRLRVELEGKDSKIANLTAERDALREGEMGDARHSNTRAAADIYFQLVEECEIPAGGSLVEYVDDMREKLEAAENRIAELDERERNQQYIKSRDQENEDIALTVGKLRVELEAEKQRAKDLFMENARLKSGIAGLIHLGIRYADVEVMRIAGDAQLSTPCTDSIINSIATGIRIKGGE